MPAPDNLTMVANYGVNPREIDFVARFGRNWEALLDIMGVSRPIRKEAGAVLKYKEGKVTLHNGLIGEGEDIPYSQAEVVERTFAEMTLEKFKKGVSAEAIKSFGYDIAVGKTDDAFLDELQFHVMDKFYDFAKTGSLSNIQHTYQTALAMAKGLVVNKFKAMHRSASEVVAFANVLDVYEYLGSANITVQNQFGFNYIKDFMGINTIFLCSENEIPRGKIVATPVDNIVCYYVDPSMADFAQAELRYTVDGETNLIGFHTAGNYDNMTSNAYAVMGIVLFAEYLDGIAVIDIEANDATNETVTGTSAYGGASGKTKLTVTSDDHVGGAKYYFKAQASTAPSAPSHGASVPDGWALIPADGIVEATNGHKATIIEVNGSGQVVGASSAITVVSTAG